MLDLGQVESFNASDRITFTYNGKDYELTPTARQVMAFHTERVKESTSTNAAVMAYTVTAPLFGSKYDPEKNTFTGGVIAKLIKEDIEWSALDRLITSVFIYFTSGSDLALAFMETGDFLAAVTKVNEERQSRLIQPALGETSGDDSVENPTA